MYFLKTEAAFDSAHFLYGYEGKCSNIHGHRWKIEVTVQNAFLQRNGQKKGMIMDFTLGSQYPGKYKYRRSLFRPHMVSACGKRQRTTSRMPQE